MNTQEILELHDKLAYLSGNALEDSIDRIITKQTFRSLREEGWDLREQVWGFLRACSLSKYAFAFSLAQVVDLYNSALFDWILVYHPWNLSEDAIEKTHQKLIYRLVDGEELAYGIKYTREVGA